MIFADQPTDVSPIHSMAVAPWKQILQTCIRINEKGCRHARYFQIATVRPDGRPANRTVVFRGFLWETNKITFVTDSRSSKITDISQSPYAEIAWYFTDTREQFRVLGKVQVIDATMVDEEKLQRARASAWKNMSDPGRQQFLWPYPGLVRPETEDDALFKPTPPGQEDPVADSFCLCIVDVEEVDHLQLKTNERRLYKLKEDGETWDETYVNP